jgi:hypothetical protein
MPLLEDHTAAFIVRVWCEGNELGSVSSEWRGSIEHVPSGRRSFFRDLSSIGQFMKPYLEQLGIDTPSRFWELVADDDDGLDIAPPAR